MSASTAAHNMSANGEVEPHLQQTAMTKSDGLAESLGQLSLDTGRESMTSATTASTPTVLTPTRAPSSLSRKSSSTSLRRGSMNTANDRPLSSPRLNRKSSSSKLGDDEPAPKRSPMIRRTSSSQHLSPRSPSSNHSTLASEKPPLTAAAVAAAHFKKELALHADPASPCAETLVVVHDQCYGHRFSRPRTSKANLSLIVERPERLQASVLGISSAYVRLGERHCDGANGIHPEVEPVARLPFRIKKTSREMAVTSPMVANVHGTKWMQELKAMCELAGQRLSTGVKELARPDTPSSISRPKLHEGDLYLCAESLNAFQGALGGVAEGVDAIFDGSHKRAFVCVRPPGHHCSADMPSGFCWLNNVHVGIEYAAQTHGLTHAAIIDFDLHHGDGSQSIAWERNTKALKQPKNAPLSKKTAIGYFSVHDINSYPCEWGEVEKVQSASLCIENAHGQSVWNVHLQPWKTEEDFWNLYRERYFVLLEKTRNFLKLHTERIRASPGNTTPKAAIFLSAGFDASEWEGEGMQRHKVNVPTEFYARFTADVVAIAQEEGLGCDGRVISVLEGGYSNRALTSGVLSHLTGLTNAAPQQDELMKAGLAPLHPLLQQAADASSGHPRTFDKRWWNAESLAELESALHPGSIPVPPKKTRTQELSNFASPTQSFTAKAVDPSKIRSTAGPVRQMPSSRPPTPPPPDVDWAVASCELSRLLIPSDRQVDSCRHDELSEPRVKKERYSTAGLLSTTDQPAVEGSRQLRGRKAKGSEMKNGANSRPPSAAANRTNRRRTTSDLSSIVDDVEPPPAMPIPLAGDGPIPSNQVEIGEVAARPPTSRFNSASEISVPKTRRQSASKAELSQAASGSSEDVPALPPLPAVQNASASQNDSPVPEMSVAPASSVDALTTGVTKLTLKYTPPTAPSTSSSNTSTQAKALKASTSRAPAKQPRKAPAPKAPKPMAAKVTKAKTVPAPTTDVDAGSIGQESQGAQQSASSIPPSQIPTKINGTLSSFAQSLDHVPRPEPVANDASQDATTTSTGPPYPSSAIVDAADVFISYQPDSNPPSSIPLFTQAPRTAPLTWLPPNSATPAQTPVKRTREDLPQFTASSFIPFSDGGSTAGSRPATSSGGSAVGSLSVDGAGGAAGENEKGGLWDVPDTPRKG